MLGGQRGDRLDPRFRVSSTGARVLVPTLGLKKNGGHALFAEVGERRVPKLVERGTITLSAEQLPCHLVAFDVSGRLNELGPVDVHVRSHVRR